jgi:hypothetical protein
MIYPFVESSRVSRLSFNAFCWFGMTYCWRYLCCLLLTRIVLLFSRHLVATPSLSPPTTSTTSSQSSSSSFLFLVVVVLLPPRRKEEVHILACSIVVHIIDDPIIIRSFISVCNRNQNKTTKQNCHNPLPSFYYCILPRSCLIF